MALLLLGLPLAAAAQRTTLTQVTDTVQNETQLLERLRNMPNIEVGNGISFRPKNERFELTLRFRMQDLVSLSFDEDFTLRKTEARVKRLRLRFD